MSLKAFHIVFIVASILVAFGCGAWACWQYSQHGGVANLIFGAASIPAGIALIFYGKYVLKKLKDISYL
jgi:hypothetical protein